MGARSGVSVAAASSCLALLFMAADAPSAAPPNPFASPGEAGVGEGWVVYPAGSAGNGVAVEDGSLVFSNPQPDRRIRVCTAEPMEASSRVRIVGEWKREGIVSKANWQGAWLELVPFAADGQRIRAEGWDGNVIIGPGSSDWAQLRYATVLPEGTRSVRLCAELRGSSEGSFRLRDLHLGDTAGTSPGNGKNVLFIVVDTLRADMLGVYGQKKPLSPNLDRFAEQAWVADHAWAQWTATTPSVVSTMLSQYPRTHAYTYDSRVTAKDIVPLSERVPTLAQLLRDHGYVTAGISANARVRPQLGVTRGFERWMLPGTDEQVVRYTLEDLAAWPDDDAPNFFYAHLMTTHVTLAPSEEAQRAAGVSVEVPEIGMNYWGSTPPEDRAKDRATHDRLFRDAYMASVYDADRFVQQILDALEATGEADRTAVIFASDHGELLGEHDLMGHGNHVWEPLTSVPLMLRLPGEGSGRITDRVAELIDIAPTVLEYLGLADRIPPEWQGSSLLRPPTRQVAASQRLNMVAFTADGRHKTIETHQGGGIQREGYDLHRDRGEQRPLGDGEGIQPLLDYAPTWYQTIPAGRREGELIQATEEQTRQEIEMLEALGYIQ
jgi:arylsulfatase A-like enzyme